MGLWESNEESTPPEKFVVKEADTFNVFQSWLNEPPDGYHLHSWNVDQAMYVIVFEKDARVSSTGPGA